MSHVNHLMPCQTCGTGCSIRSRICHNCRREARQLAAEGKARPLPDKTAAALCRRVIEATLVYSDRPPVSSGPVVQEAPNPVAVNLAADLLARAWGVRTSKGHHGTQH